MNTEKIIEAIINKFKGLSKDTYHEYKKPIREFCFRQIGITFRKDV